MRIKLEIPFDIYVFTSIKVRPEITSLHFACTQTSSKTRKNNVKSSTEFARIKRQYRNGT